MIKEKRFFRITSILLLLLFSYSYSIAQGITRPVVGNACIVDLTKEFTVTSSLEPGEYPATTVFSLVLSNKFGQFDNTVLLAETTAVGNRLTFMYSYPQFDGSGTTLGSDQYRVRVEPNGIPKEDITNRSSEFSAYFYDGFIFEVFPGSLCGSMGGVLSANVDLDEYVWFKDNAIIPGETSKTLTITQTGNYYFLPNFGDCLGNLTEGIKGAIVDVDTAAGVAFTIAPSKTPIICLDDSVTLSSDFTDPTYEYQWAKDGEPIAGETGTSIIVSGANSGGDYTLLVTDTTLAFDDCRTSSSNRVAVEVNPSIKLLPPFQIFNIPGQDVTLTATTTGDNATITWTRDEVDIPNSNSTSINVNAIGTYEAKISSTTPCNGEVSSEEKIVVLPTGDLKVSIDYDISNYVDCEFSEVGLQITEILVEVPGEEDTVLPSTSYGSLDIRWFKDGIDTNRRGSTITLSNIGNNGNYEARVFSGSSRSFTSNPPLDVSLNISGINIQPAAPIITEGETVTLSIDIPESLDISDFESFQWFQGDDLIPGANTSQLLVSEVDRYKAEVRFEGCTTQTLGPITVQGSAEDIPNAVIPESNSFLNRGWVLPQEYTLQNNIGVTIYSNNGEEDFSVDRNYNGQWPLESASRLKESLYYYIIFKDNQIEKQGSITVIR